MSNADPQYIVCLLWWSSIVPSFVLAAFFYQNHSLLSFSFPLLILFSSNIPFTFSFAKVFFFFGISMHFYGITIGFLWNSYGISMMFL